MTEFLNIPLFDDDFYKMMFRFVLNLGFLTLIIRWLYFGATKRKDYLFTYYMIGIIVFFLCSTIHKSPASFNLLPSTPYFLNQTQLN